MHVEIKYLSLLSSRLQLFKKKGDYLWNFRCPICGDSKRNRTKARGFVFKVKDGLLFKCHNCGASMALGSFIKQLDPVLFKQYTMEKFKRNTPYNKHQIKKFNKIISKVPEFKRDVLSGLTRVEDLNTTHPAKEYLLNRKLPLESLYYTDNFKEWINTIKPNTFKGFTTDEPRIIIPFIDKEGNVFGVQGRALHNDGLRYVTILFEEDQPKIFGLDRINENEKIFITEGPFDSLLLDNAVAMAGSDLSNYSDHLGSNVVFVFDNEPRNKEIKSRMDKHIKDGHSIVIWPSHIIQKDINDMFLAGIDVQNLVESSIYQSINAQLQFNSWVK